MSVLEREAKVTAQGQTTVPAPIREALGVQAGDRITFAVDAGGTVTVRRSEEPDPAIGAFLEFLASDMHRRPEAIRPLTSDLEKRLRELTADTEVDAVNDRIRGDVGL